MPVLPSLLKIIIRPDTQDLQRLNLLFMPAVITTGALLGGILSVVIISGMVWAAMQLLRPSLPYCRQPRILMIAACFAALFVAELIAGLVNFNGEETWIQVIENTPFLLFLPFYSVIYAPRRDLRAAIEKAALIAAFLVAAVALLQFFIYGARADGASNAGVFAVMCLILFTLNALAFVRQDAAVKWIAGLAAIAAAMALLLSGMRSLWPALGFIPLAIALVYMRGYGLRMPKKSFGWALLCLALAAPVLFQPVRERIAIGIQDFESLTNNNYRTSLGERVVLWKAASQLIAEKPVFGQGPGRLPAVMAEKAQQIVGYPLFFTHFHNAVLTYWVRSGLPGVTALLMILAVPLVCAWQNVTDEPSRYGLTLLISLDVIYLSSGLFNIMFGQDVMDTVFIGSTAIAVYLVFGREGEGVQLRQNVTPAV